MRKLSIILLTLTLIVGMSISASAWNIKPRPCMNIKIDMSPERVESSAVRLAILIKSGILLMDKLPHGATGLCLIHTEKFNPWNLESEYLVQLVIHALRVRPSADVVILGVGRRPLFIFTYHRDYGKLCCEGVDP